MKKLILLLMLILPSLHCLARVPNDLQVLPAQKDKETPLVIFLSGDGGWAALDKGLSQQFQQHGFSVIGWNSLKYFWHKKTPAQTSQDLTELLAQYLPQFNKKQWLLVGFSFGAEIVPFIINRIPNHYREQLTGAVLLSPSTSSDFEIHMQDMLSQSSQGQLLTKPQVQAIHDVPMLCIDGQQDEDDDKLCPRLTQANVQHISLIGGHHFDDDYAKLYQTIISHLDFDKNY